MRSARMHVRQLLSAVCPHYYVMKKLVQRATSKKKKKLQRGKKEGEEEEKKKKKKKKPREPELNIQKCIGLLVRFIVCSYLGNCPKHQIN